MKIVVVLLTIIWSCLLKSDDTDLRNYYMPLAAAAYSDNPSQCLTNIQNYWNNYEERNDVLTFYRQYTFDCDLLNDTCVGYTAVYHQGSEGGVIIVAFRGTTKFDQLFEEAWHFKETVPFLGGKVSKYFYDGFYGIWFNRGMKDDVLTLRNKYPNYVFNVVGHSLGGAMASLAAATISSLKIQQDGYVALITYGQPRTGDKDFAAAFDALPKSASWRIIHNRDPVPHLPPLDQSVYYHHMVEYWYPNDMDIGDNYEECYSSSGGEDPDCSDSLTFTLSKDDHKYYYGREVNDYGVNGCSDLVKEMNVKQASENVTKRSRPYRLKTMENSKL